MSAARLWAPRGAGRHPSPCRCHQHRLRARAAPGIRDASHVRPTADGARLLVVLITIEGLDGAGKTTLARGLVDALRARGRRVELLREPGGVELSERIRELVKDPSRTVDPRAEALLYAAARAQLVAERVRPLLDDGATVLLDRFVDSSLAYQGAARGLGIEAVRGINAFATGGLQPDLTLLLRVPLAVSRERQEGTDRMEQEDDAFFAVIAAAYDDLAAAEPGRFRVIDAGQPPAAVLEAAVASLEAT